jgi:hypothetical protein
MAIETLAELDAARAKARAMVHSRALRAAARAAAPVGFGQDAVAHLVHDIEAVFGLTAEERAALAPTMVKSFADLAAAYAPGAAGGEALAGLAARLAANPVARVASRSLAGRFVTRVAKGRGLLGVAARRAWLIPAALAGGAAATYELLGRRCINSCYAYLRDRIPTPAATATG